ncbi:MAG: phosphoribosyltransferase family protein [Bacillota bacterium]
MKILSGLIDLVFPPSRACPLCGEFDPRGEICPGCLDKLSAFRKEPVCYRCGRYFQQASEIKYGTVYQPPDPGEPPYCRDCLNGATYFHMSRSAGPYEGDLKRAVQRLKFSGKRDLAGHISGIMFQSVANNQYYNKIGIIVAVPLSPGRLRQRGFNQAELLAGGLAERIKVPVLPVLRKVRETSSQTGLDRAGRKENLVGAFKLTHPQAIRGKTVLVVDDVITTGSTLNIVSEALVNGGAATVICITAAAGRTSMQRGSL